MLRFKGTDSTFGSFPERLQHTLSETIENVKVESVVFPAYEVRCCAFSPINSSVRAELRAGVVRDQLRSDP